jgi:hypothetical protein
MPIFDGFQQFPQRAIIRALARDLRSQTHSRAGRVSFSF